MDRLSAFNKYCSKNNLNIRFSIVREINFDYLFEIVSVIEQLMAKNSIQVVHGKGKKKHELQRYQEAFKEDALNLNTPYILILQEIETVFRRRIQMQRSCT